MTEPVTIIDRSRAVLVLVATIGVIAFNWLASAGYVNGVTPGEISDNYPTPVTPAGYAFSIWSLIYLGMLAFSIYQMLGPNINRFRHIRSTYILSCALNCAWIFFWHGDQIAICLVIIAALWASLLVINIKLKNPESTLDSFLAKAPFGIYLGWVTAATLVNLAVLLRKYNVEIASGQVLGAVLILFATLIAVLVRIKLKNYFTPLAVAWALTAIAVKQSGQTLIVSAAAVGVIACLIASASVAMDLKSSHHE